MATNEKNTEVTEPETVRVQGNIAKGDYDETFMNEAWELRLTKGQYIAKVFADRAAQYRASKA